MYILIRKPIQVEKNVVSISYGIGHEIAPHIKEFRLQRKVT